MRAVKWLSMPFVIRAQASWGSSPRSGNINTDLGHSRQGQQACPHYFRPRHICGIHCCEFAVLAMEGIVFLLRRTDYLLGGGRREFQLRIAGIKKDTDQGIMGIQRRILVKPTWEFGESFWGVNKRRVWKFVAMLWICQAYVFWADGRRCGRNTEHTVRGIYVHKAE